ncbi:MAG: glycosyltransferase [Chloroflexi bacterium]|nr:glycosyltransferase [Chloroflexota bacterium]
MILAILAPGSRGDVQPYLALGQGLQRRGHIVRLLASADFRDLVAAHGLEFADLGGSMQAVAQEMQHLLEQGNLLKILSSMDKAARQLAVQAAHNGLAACQGADLLLAGLGGLFVGVALAEKLGIPLIPAYLYPFTPTRAFPGVLTPLPQTLFIRWANPLSHRLAQGMMWQTTRGADNHARSQVL